jgi:imidazole glycerol-phosphate synthase subunit HisF
MTAVIPSLDILDSQVVRLTRGDYATASPYGRPEEVLDRLDVPRGSRLHVVDLAGSRDGRPTALDVVRRLASRDIHIQAGGGVRTADDVQQWLDAGAEKAVVGTVAADDPELLETLVRRFGAAAIVPAIDVDNGVVRVAGWKRDASASLEEVLGRVERLGIAEILVTDIRHDGLLAGPSFALYRRLAKISPLRVIASGGVTTSADVVSLARLPNVSGCVIGKALLDGRLALAEAVARAAEPDAIPPRVIPCLDISDGRVVKGVSFTGIRDAGDPVECAVRYEEEGADEIVILDISASDRGVATALETVRRAADSIFIPLTVGGGVRTVDDFRAMLRAGADRVAINTAAVKRPELIREVASEFGVQAVVLSCDVKDREVMVRSGKEPAGLDAAQWCRVAEDLGAGEILLTSVNRDGTALGFDIDLLRAVRAAVRINIIASGGAGTLEHFSEAIESGGANAVLAASLFHDRKLTVGEVKRHLAAEGIPVR